MNKDYLKKTFESFEKIGKDSGSDVSVEISLLNGEKFEFNLNDYSLTDHDDVVEFGWNRDRVAFTTFFTKCVVINCIASIEFRDKVNNPNYKV